MEVLIIIDYNVLNDFSILATKIVVGTGMLSILMSLPLVIITLSAECFKNIF